MVDFNDFGFDNFPLEIKDNAHIKVVGIGGGGCNVVAKIFNTNLKAVDLIICNTDEQALNSNIVNYKIKLGSETLGAGLNPEKGRAAAKSSEREIEAVFQGNTEMVFITTCLGGGTGTGAAPVIAEIAKKMNKLVVAVVTLPFRDEGIEFMERALAGLKELRKYVDSTIVIDNQKIYEPYGDLTMHEAYAKVDEILVTAVKGISEMVTVSGKINVDMNDVKTIMSNSKTATIGIGKSTISEGVGVAVENALNSPLLNDCNFASSKGALVVLACDDTKTPMSARKQVTETVQSFAGNPTKFKLGVYTGREYGDEITVTVVITGFDLENVPGGGLNDGPVIIDENGDVVTNPDKNQKNKFRKFNGDNIPQEIYKRRPSDRPVLVVEAEQELLELENEPAFERKSRKKREKIGGLENPGTSNSFTIREVDNRNIFSTDNSYLHKTQD